MAPLTIGCRRDLKAPRILRSPEKEELALTTSSRKMKKENSQTSRVSRRDLAKRNSKERRSTSSTRSRVGRRRSGSRRRETEKSWRRERESFAGQVQGFYVPWDQLLANQRSSRDQHLR